MLFNILKSLHSYNKERSLIYLDKFNHIRDRIESVN